MGEKMMNDEEHKRQLNTCRDCGFQDEDITGIKNHNKYVIGSICNECTKKRDIAYDFNHAQEHGSVRRDNEIMCPYCGSIDGDSWEHNDSSSYTCNSCDETCDLEVEYTPHYTTMKREK
jgi:DNA-directed RNA polymerase subunit RPC12/RpoP